LPALVDATFLKRDQRAQFQSLAAKHKVRFAILDVQAAESTLHKRVALRAAGGSDASEASEAVLERQITTQERLTSEEQVWTRCFDGERITPENVTRQLLAIAPTMIAGDH
jgi:hypothetical protein